MSATTKNLQIDVLPAKEPNAIPRIHLYIDGICYNLYVNESTINRMVSDSIVQQVKGMRHNDKDELVEFDYPEGIDSAGVKYTSVVFEMKPKHTNP